MSLFIFLGVYLTPAFVLFLVLPGIRNWLNWSKNDEVAEYFMVIFWPLTTAVFILFALDRFRNWLWEHKSPSESDVAADFRQMHCSKCGQLVYKINIAPFEET